MYRYFISFAHVINGNIGFGNTELVLNGKITGMDMLKKIARNCFVKNVVILNFRLFEE